METNCDIDSHSKPAEDASCLSCWEELSDENYVEYKANAGERFTTHII
jgi:hypothetical protein